MIGKVQMLQFADIALAVSSHMNLDHPTRTEVLKAVILADGIQKLTKRLDNLTIVLDRKGWPEEDADN